MIGVATATALLPVDGNITFGAILRSRLNCKDQNATEYGGKLYFRHRLDNFVDSQHG